MKFCPKCGKEINEGTFCKDCSEETVLDPTKIKPKDYLVCKECSRIFIHNVWKKSSDIKLDIEEFIKNDIVKSQKLNEGVKLKVKIPSTYYEEFEANDTGRIAFQTEIIASKGRLMDEYLVETGMIFQKCSSCGKKNTKYFEGVLQLRNPDEELNKFLEAEFLKAENDNIYVTARDKQPNGTDYYITARRYVAKISQILQENFGGTLKINERLFSHDSLTSKDLFRVNAIFIQSPVRRGDILDVNGMYSRVIKVGKFILAQELGTVAKIRIEFNNDLKKIQLSETQIIKNYPNIEAMHPETYETMDVITDRKLKVGDKINIVNYKNKLYHIY